MERPAIVLLSGGLDSTTVLAIARDQGFTPYVLTFRYGQRHAVELLAAAAVIKAQAVERHVVVDADLRVFGGSALTSEISVPKRDGTGELVAGIPITYVPARNTIFLSYALAYAEVVGASDIFIGISSLDYSGYPDCRPEYLQAYQAMANLATRAGVEGAGMTIHAPLISMTKADTIRCGLTLGINYGLTSSCYYPGLDGLSCGHCDSCLLRLKAFAEVGIPDPLRYA